MSQIRLIVRDARREIHGTPHASFADAALAALAAEPETIEELDVALERFHRRDEGSFFRHFTARGDDEPHDAGLAVIDLAARLVCWSSTYSAATARGTRFYHDGRSSTDVEVRYLLSDDWLLTSSVLGWRPLAERRRAELTSNPPLDARAVLYGRPLLEYVVGASMAAREVPPDEGAVRDVHARWLMTPREDLRGQAPRDVLLAKRDFISWDLQHRAEQWAQMGACPRGLEPPSRAFRLAGFGTHEVVKYYDMVRGLLWSCRRCLEQQSAALPEEFVAAEVERLGRLRDEWLDTPDPECQGLTPREVIDHERARLPEGVSGRAAMIDCDCPLCQMMAESPEPVFWNLDGSGMDDEFAFSFYRTLAEWEQEQRDREEFSRKLRAERQEREQLGLDESDSPWRHSYAAPDSDELPLGVRLFGIGSLLAELIVDLKSAAEERPLIERLQSDFGNLREVVGASEPLTDALLEPVLGRFGETLADVASVRADLGEKCSDLERRLRRFLERSPVTDPPESFDDDLPF
jgi:hypothetical protein